MPTYSKELLQLLEKLRAKVGSDPEAMALVDEISDMVSMEAEPEPEPLEGVDPAVVEPIRNIPTSKGAPPEMLI